MSKRTNDDAALEEDLLDLVGEKADSPPPAKRQRISGASSSANDNKERVYYEHEFDDGFDANCYGDEEDRHKLSLLPELEREEIIAQRFEKREQLHARKEMLRERGLLRSSNEDVEDDAPSKKKKSSKASAKSSASSSREDRSTRAKMEKQESLSDLKAKRNAAKEKAQNKASERKPRKYTSDDEEDEDYNEPTSSNSKDSASSTSASSKQIDKSAAAVIPIQDSQEVLQQKKADADAALLNNPRPVGYDDLLRLQLKREKLEQWVNEARFAELVTDCFVKVCIGEDSGRSVYRVAQITNVQVHPKNKPSYKIDPESRMLTGKYLVLKVGGSSSKTFPMSRVSNSSMSLSEFQYWFGEAQSRQAPIPTIGFVHTKVRQQNKIFSQRKYNPSNLNSVLKRRAIVEGRLLVLRDSKPSDYEKNEDEVLQLVSEQLQSLEDELKELKRLQEELTALKATAHGDAITKINEKHRKTNTQAQSADGAQQKKGASGDLDPFARRSTVSKGVLFSMEASPAPNSEAPAAQPSPIDSLKPKAGSAPVVPQSPLKSPGTTLLDAFNFELDHDPMSIQETTPTTASAVPQQQPAKQASTTAASSGKKGLSLSDYKKLKGNN